MKTADGADGRPRRSLGEALREVDELNQVCAAFREGYLRLHPDAPPTEVERRYAAAVAYVREHHGVDWSDALGVLPAALRPR